MSAERIPAAARRKIERLEREQGIKLLQGVDE